MGVTPYVPFRVNTMLCDDFLNWISQTLSSPESILLYCGWFGSLSLCVLYYGKRISRVYLRQWYDLSKRGPNEDMDWREIRRILNEDALKKMSVVERLRFPPRYLLRDIPTILVLGLVFYSAFMLLPHFGRIGKEYGIALGLVTVMVSVVAIFYNVRLKARAQNRQEWINSLRTEIGALISESPPQHATGHKDNNTTLSTEKHLRMLELYLNPSEFVHRALLTLLRFMYGYFDREVDVEIREALSIEVPQCSGQANSVALGVEQWREWRIKAVRLANVLLKREWEQVKHVK